MKFLNKAKTPLHPEPIVIQGMKTFADQHRDDNACVNVLRRGMGFDILGTSPIA